MSHFRNVETIVKSADNYDVDELVLIFEDAAREGSLNVLADDICYIVTTLFAGYSPTERARLMDKFRTEITQHAIKQLELELNDD